MASIAPGLQVGWIVSPILMERWHMESFSIVPQGLEEDVEGFHETKFCEPQARSLIRYPALESPTGLCRLLSFLFFLFFYFLISKSTLPCLFN